MFAVAWGLAVGTTVTAGTSLYSMLIPGGKESGYYGVRVFCGSTFVWLPSVLHALINEYTDNLRVAMLSTNIFFIAGMGAISLVDVSRGVQRVSSTIKVRRCLSTK